MYPPHLTYLKGKENIWFNPSNGIVGFWDQFRKVKEKFPEKPFYYIWNHRDLKRDKEIYITAITAMGISILENQKGGWWFLKPPNDPPDGVIGTQVNKNDGTEMHVREVEIVEHFRGDILETIKNKLSGKHYEPNTVLICFLSTGGVQDFEKLASIISKDITNLNNIFLAFHGLKISDIPKDQTDEELIHSMFKISLVQLKSVYNFITIDLMKDTEEWRNGKEKNFLIFDHFGRGDLKEVTLENPPMLFE